MMRSHDQHTLGGVTGEDFVGRTLEMERLIGHAVGTGPHAGLALLATPGCGSTELLRQVFDRLFAEQEEVIPVYFSVKQSDVSGIRAARRFLREFLIKTVAFRRRDRSVLDVAPDINEIAELAVPVDAALIDRLIETAGEYGNDDEPARLRSFLSAPLRACASGARVFVMIDDLHETTQLQDGQLFLETLNHVFDRGSFPFVLCGHRRFLYEKTRLRSMSLDHLSFSEAGTLIESRSAKFGIALTEQCRDLIAVQLQGNPRFINFIIARAAETASGLESFQQFQTVYADELFGGRIGRYYDERFDRAMPDTVLQNNIAHLISDLLDSEMDRTSREEWSNHSAASTEDFHGFIRSLNCDEIISVDSNSVAASLDNLVLGDYVKARRRLISDHAARGQIVGESLSNYIKRAPALMARFYRRMSAIGLREVMLNFDGSQIASSLIDYSKFKTDLKGLSKPEIEKVLAVAGDVTRLPHIVYTAHSVDFYRQIGEVIDAEHSAIALGFEENETRSEIVWIAAEIDSKLEATGELTEFWCDRLEMIAASCDFGTYRIWLVAPEGFSPEACGILTERNVIGSSRKQVEMLIRHVGAELFLASELNSEDYEVVIPMGDDTEMIAAHTVEEIAKRHNFPAKTINQIKTALVEACINASEHSLSPDRKIYQKFAVTDEKMTITISNRGLRLADKAAQQVTTQEGRRGWGLKLIQGLMDDVVLEQTDDGTRITMTKFARSQTDGPRVSNDLDRKS